MVLRNFRESANTIKPRITFTEFSQPPDFGNRSSNEGTNASMVKGKAKAMEKASMVTIGSHTAPWVDSIKTVPTIGPVQENDTRTRVSARKKIPRMPPLSAFASVFVVHFAGRTNSKAPKNEAAKTRNKTKKIIFGIQCVASQLKILAVTEAPPVKYVIPIIIAIGRV